MTFSNTTSKFARIAFALAALSTAGTTLARETERQETIYYHDLDLTSDAGVNALDRRLDQAVRLVCGRGLGLSLMERRLVGQCYDETKSSVEPQREIAIARAGARRDRFAARTQDAAIRIAFAN